MRATDLLERQRQGIRQLLDRVQAGSRGAIKDLSRVLTAQMAAERELFYPAVLHLAQNEVLEAWENQQLAGHALRRVLSARIAGKNLKTRVRELRRTVLALAESEERSLLPSLEGKIPSDRLETLGAEMEARFTAVFRKLWARRYLGPTRKPSVAELTRMARTRHSSHRALGERRPHAVRGVCVTTFGAGRASNDYSLLPVA